MPDNPTIVLVHGAFADGASGGPVTAILLDQGYDVWVPPVSIGASRAIRPTSSRSSNRSRGR